jgi:hypothetical protein
MTNASKSTKVFLFLYALGSQAIWAAPPNPTASDARGNTAGGTNAVVNVTTGSNNTGFGLSALQRNTIGDFNTASGYAALFFNTTGDHNTASGALALLSNTTGSFNTASGEQALQNNTTGNTNTATGYRALYLNTTGIYNTASGTGALYSNTTGSNNTATGINALPFLTAGNNNTSLGSPTLYKLTAGSNNLALGANAGSNLKSGSNNVYLANAGAASESSAIRIGSNQSRTFIAGIRARRTGAANAVPVVIDSNGQLGTINSSARFKKDIQDMADASHKLLQLRPVTYRYKEADDNGANPIEYGLIAEEVAKVYPDLVAHGADGQIETVQYHKLTPMLLNELQNMNKSLQAANQQGESLASQLKAEQELNQQLVKEMAGLIKAQTVKVAALEQQVAALQTQAKVVQTLTARLSRIEAGQMVGLNR